MPYYVMLEFEDDVEAMEYLRGQAVIGAPSFGEGLSKKWKSTIRGVWKKPTKFCECSADKRNIVKGRKYGWWVHDTCGKPSKLHTGWFTSGRMRLEQLGFNLLPKEMSGESNPHHMPREFLKINS